MPNPQFLLDSWTWGNQPSMSLTLNTRSKINRFCLYTAKEQLFAFTQSLNNEQRNLCTQAANLSLSASRLHQRLIIFKRYFIALNRTPHISDFDNGSATQKTGNCDIRSTSKISVRCKVPVSTDPTVGLARVGSRAALNFAFAFLRRAWRLGKLLYYVNKAGCKEHKTWRFCIITLRPVVSIILTISLFIILVCINS